MQNIYLIYPKRHVSVCGFHSNSVVYPLPMVFVFLLHSPTLQFLLSLSLFVFFFFYVFAVSFFVMKKNVWWCGTNIKIWFSLWYCLLNVCDKFAHIVLTCREKIAWLFKNKKNETKKKWKSFKVNFYVELTIFTCAQSTYHQCDTFSHYLGLVICLNVFSHLSSSSHAHLLPLPSMLFDCFLNWNAKLTTSFFTFSPNSHTLLLFFSIIIFPTWWWWWIRIHVVANKFLI